MNDHNFYECQNCHRTIFSSLESWQTCPYCHSFFRLGSRIPGNEFVYEGKPIGPFMVRMRRRTIYTITVEEEYEKVVLPKEPKIIISPPQYKIIHPLNQDQLSPKIITSPYNPEELSNLKGYKKSNPIEIDWSRAIVLIAFILLILFILFIVITYSGQ